MKIQTNTAANSALGYMRTNAMNTERSIQKLSSGFRINRAADDAAGLAIANKLRADGKSLAQAQRNTAQGTAMLQVMDGATQTISTILDRMKELATQSNSDNVGNQRTKLDAEFGQLRSEIQRIVDTTKYQGKTLVDGGFGNSVTTATSTLLSTAATGVTGVTLNGAAAATYTLVDTAGSIAASATINGSAVTQTVTGGAVNTTMTFDQLGFSVQLGQGYAAGNADGTIVVAAGANGGSFQVSSSGAYSGQDQITLTKVDLNTATVAGLNLSGLDLTSMANSQTALSRLDTAIDKVNTALGDIGAAQSRMDFASSNVATMLQNTQAAESTIRDADMAQEMTTFTKNNILQQAAQSMLAQANQGQQGILQLLRG
jgi:flagellin